MKVALTPLPDSLPTYHPMTILLEYFYYLYNALPTRHKKVGEMDLKELHTGFRDTYESVLKGFLTDRIKVMTEEDEEFLAPILELEVLVRLYSPNIISYAEHKRGRASRTARIDEILLGLE